MRSRAPTGPWVELSISHPKNSLCVEIRPERVVIRLARDNLSASEKLCLVHYLAAEGFIPDHYERMTCEEMETGNELLWTTGGAFPSHPPARTHSLGKLLRVLLWAGLLWLALMTFAFLQAR